MRIVNLTSFTDNPIVHPDFFFIRGFEGIPHIVVYYVFCCFVYALSVLGNTFVMFLIYTDHCLHSPKYIAVFSLAVGDMCGSTAFVPPLIDTFLFKSHLISFDACLAHMFFIFWFLSIQSYTLTVLSYDRYIAICFPLRYNEIMTKKFIFVIITILWIFPGICLCVGVMSIYILSFCKSIVINSYFCDQPMYTLACNDYTLSVVIAWFNTIMALWFPILFITGTYICIARALFKIAEASERLKAMKTCTSHLILVCVFYIPMMITYAIGPAIPQNARMINLSLATLLPPVLNPIIYSLKTKEFTESIKKLYRRKKIHFIVRNKCFNYK